MKLEVQECLRSQGFEENLIQEACANFNPDISVKEYLYIGSNRQIVKSMAFSSYPAMQAALDDGRKSTEASKLKRVTIPVNAKFILANVKASDCFLDEQPREKFLGILKEYVEPLQSDDPRAKILLTNSVLRGIRQNCLLSAKLFLKAKDMNITYPLSSLAVKSDDQCQSRTLSFKDLEKATSLCKTSKAEVDLLHNEKGIPVVYNCNLCPSLAPTNESPSSTLKTSKNFAKKNAKSSSSVVFTDAVLANFNCYKVNIYLFFSKR